jgi:hypothetical protein
LARSDGTGKPGVTETIKGNYPIETGSKYSRSGLLTGTEPVTKDYTVKNKRRAKTNQHASTAPSGCLQ